MNSKLVIGDIQGQAAELGAVTRHAIDTHLVCVGDLVNRGPDSAGSLRWLMQRNAQAVLGNHDLFLLVCAVGALKPSTTDTISDVLNAPDRDDLINWLRYRPLALFDDGHLLVHAGVVPHWSTQYTLERAAEVEAALRGPNWQDFLRNLWGNVPLRWSDELTSYDRLRCIVNALTRIRYVKPDGTMDLATKESTGGSPAGYMPWFDVPGRKTADTTVVFGHWSTMGLINRPNLIGLDTGCVWGGKLTAVELHAQWTQRTFSSQSCRQVAHSAQSVRAP